MKKIALIQCFVASIFCCFSTFAQSNYKIGNKIHIEGDGRWDCISVDETNGRIYVSHADKAQAIDIKTGKIVGTIPDTKGIHDIAIAADINKGFTSNGHDSSITIFNLKTLEIIKKVNVNKLMVIIDAKTGKVITTLPIGSRCDGAAFDPAYKRAYSSNGEGTITVVQEENSNSFKVLETVTTQSGARTITLDNTTHHLYLPTAEFVSEPSANNRRPAVKPNTFVILDVETLK